MESPCFAMDDDDQFPNPMWTLQQPPMQQQQLEEEEVVIVGDDCGGGVVVAHEATTAAEELMIPSEWSFESLLEEDLMKNTAPAGSEQQPPPAGLHIIEPAAAPPGDATAAAPAGSGAPDPIEYNAMLKRKLEVDLAAIAMWRGSGTPRIEISQGSAPSLRNVAQDEFRDDGRGHVQNSCFCSKFPACSSSMEPSQSDYDDMDGEVEILGCKMPDLEKVKKRKLSNRESARRSRTRRAAHMKELEDQVAHLRVEKSLLLKRLDEVNEKYSASAVDNRILRADLETLRMKVKMAEDTVNRLMGSTSTPSFSNMPFVASPSHANATPPAVPIQDDNNMITNNYFITVSDDAVVVNDSSFVPSATAPSPLQAEGVVNGRSSNAVVASSLCAMAMELQQNTMSTMPAAPAPEVPIQNNNITNNYYTAASDAGLVSDSSFVPSAVEAPSPLQAEEVVVNGSSNAVAAASHCAMAREPELNTVSAIPDAPPPAVPIQNNNIIINSYTPASDAGLVNDSSFVPSAAAPSPLQAEGVVNGRSSNAVVASSLCAMAMELQQNTMSTMPAAPYPEVPIQNNNISNNYYTAASVAGLVNVSSFVPSAAAAAPSPLQAERVVSGSSNAVAAASSHCAMAMAMELQQITVSTMPAATAAAGDEAVPLSGLVEVIDDSNMEGH